MATTNNEGQKTVQKKSKWALPGMGQAMLNLIDPERAPDVITITYNNVVTRMLRVVDSETNEIFYTGVPEYSDGKRTWKCKFGFTLSCDGYFDGSAALNFITNGGWKRGAKKPTTAQKAQAREEFICAFLSAAIKYRDATAKPHNFEALKDLVSKDSGLTVEEGVMETKDLKALGLVGVPFYLTDLAIKRGLKLVVDVPGYIANFVQPAYAKCVQGAWDRESGQVAITSALTTAQTALMQEHGFKFKKVRQYAVKAASGGKKGPKGAVAISQQADK